MIDNVDDIGHHFGVSWLRRDEDGLRFVQLSGQCGLDDGGEVADLVTALVSRLAGSPPPATPPPPTTRGWRTARSTGTSRTPGATWSSGAMTAPTTSARQRRAAVTEAAEDYALGKAKAAVLGVLKRARAVAGDDVEQAWVGHTNLHQAMRRHRLTWQAAVGELIDSGVAISQVIDTGGARLARQYRIA